MSKFQSISLPTLSDSATMKEVENESRKMGLDILNKLNSVADAQYPVGATYTQYSGQTAPALLFGGTWTDITATSLPTQIYDSGSNSLGNWIRYTDGTMQCWGTTGNITTGSPSTIVTIFFATLAQSFPQSFSSTPYVTYTPQQVGGYGWGMHVASVSTSGFTGGILSESNTYTTFLYWTAIGKWSSAPVYPVTLWKRTGGSLTTTTGTSVVTGIYDSGTNSNGSWIRFTDGTMMQWGRTAQSGAMNTANDGYFITTAFGITFPINFIDNTYSADAYAFNATGHLSQTFMTGTTSTSGFSVYPAAWGGAGATAAIMWKAIGKWK